MLDGLFSARKKPGEEFKSTVMPEDVKPPIKTFEDELVSLINRYNLESLSNTPDFILAFYLKDALQSYNNALQRRTEWFIQKHAAKDAMVKAEKQDRVSEMMPLMRDNTITTNNFNKQ